MDSLDTLRAALTDQGFGCVTISSHTAKAERQRAVSSFSTSPKVRPSSNNAPLTRLGLLLSVNKLSSIHHHTHTKTQHVQSLDSSDWSPSPTNQPTNQPTTTQFKNSNPTR